MEKMYESSGWYAINIQGKTVQFKRKGLIKVPTKSSEQSTDDEEETIGTATRNHDGHNNKGRTTPTRTNRNSNSNSTHSRNDESSATPNTGQASNNFTMEETDHLQLRERNRWLEKEVRRLNLLVELLAGELKSKVDLNET